MVNELYRAVTRYFTRLPQLDQKWKKLSKEAKNPLIALTNQAEQYRYVTSEEMGVEDSLGGETRERLIYRIYMLMETEIELLQDILKQFNDANQDLKNCLVNLENARNDVSLKDELMQGLIRGTPFRPKLDLMLEWAVEAFQYYHNMYLRISDNVKLIDYKREETIVNLVSSFTENDDKRDRIEYIFSLTQFLVKEDL